MRRILSLALALSILVPAATTQAARQPEAQLCISVVGAPEDVTPQELTDGIADGSYVVSSVRPCANRGPIAGGGPTPEPTTQPITKDTGQWVVNPVERDPLSDEPVTATWVYADGSASIALVIQCATRSQTKVHIFWNAFLDLERARITTRIDDQEPIALGWPVDEPGTSSYYPNDELAFIEDLFGATRLAAQADPWNAEPITVVFPVAGVEAAVANVRSACGW